MKTRPIIVIILTIIIGFILGMLTSAQLRYHKLKPVRVYFSEERFRDGFYQAIQPDEQQKTKIELVLNKYAKINSELQSEFRKELDASMKAFRKELDSNLTKEQLERLKEMDDRRQEMIRNNRRNRDNDTLDGTNDWRRNPDRRNSPDRIPPHRNPDRDTLTLSDSK